MDGNILIVDDEQEIADLVELYLKNERVVPYINIILQERLLIASMP